jgi:hypothetical protein
MAYDIIYPQGTATITVAAGDSVAVWSQGAGVQVFRNVGYPNYPSQQSELTGPTAFVQSVYGAYASGAELTINANAATVYYATGVAPVVPVIYQWQTQGAPVAFTAADTVTATAMLGGLTTLTQATGATVALTLATGAVLDAASDFDVGDSFDWVIINLGAGANSGTLTASTTHAIVGAAVVAAATSATFRTRKTAADTFVTYRIA